MKNRKNKLCMILILLTLTLTACSGYVSSYKATVLITAEKNNSASIEFWTFDGTKVFDLKNNGRTSGELSYKAELGSGSATVYYDDNGSKTEWFTISGGESLEGSAQLNASGKIYVIVETDGKCENGDFEFKLD